MLLLDVTTSALENGATVVSLKGKLALGRDSQQVETTIQKLLESGSKNIILDMSGINYIDSTGVGIVSFCFGKIKAGGGTLKVAGAVGTVREVFRITMLDTLVPFVASVEDAAA